MRIVHCITTSFRHEELRRQADVQGLIEPARQLIQSEHPLDRCHLRPIVELTPLVPGDRVDLVTMGFTRFFGGDFISALHILVPQLENSLRYLLKQTGVEPSAIQTDMTQESRTLSVLLTKDREALERIIDPAIVYEIKNLFDFRGGPTLRHRLAHGLVSAGRVLRTGLHLRVLVHISSLLPAVVSALAGGGPPIGCALVFPLALAIPIEQFHALARAV